MIIERAFAVCYGPGWGEMAGRKRPALSEVWSLSMHTTPRPTGRGIRRRPLLLTLHAFGNTTYTVAPVLLQLVHLFGRQQMDHRALAAAADGPASHLCHPWMDAPWPRHMRRPGYSRTHHCYVHVNDRSASTLCIKRPPFKTASRAKLTTSL